MEGSVKNPAPTPTRDWSSRRRAPLRPFGRSERRLARRPAHGGPDPVGCAGAPWTDYCRRAGRLGVQTGTRGRGRLLARGRITSLRHAVNDAGSAAHRPPYPSRGDSRNGADLFDPEPRAPNDFSAANAGTRHPARDRRALYDGHRCRKTAATGRAPLLSSNASSPCIRPSRKVRPRITTSQSHTRT